MWRKAPQTMKNINEGLASVNAQVELDVSRIRKLAGLANSATATGQRVIGENQDHEVEMARQQAYSAARDAIRVYELLTRISEQQGLEGWVQAKLTRAAEYLSAVADNLEYDSVAGEDREA